VDVVVVVFYVDWFVVKYLFVVIEVFDEFGNVVVVFEFGMFGFFGFSGWVIFVGTYIYLDKYKRYNNRPKCNLNAKVIKYKRLQDRTKIKR
jgi:hypothetical protein